MLSLSPPHHASGLAPVIKQNQHLIHHFSLLFSLKSDQLWSYFNQKIQLNKLKKKKKKKIYQVSKL